MPRGPLVTVLMSVYNDARFLPASVESILSQSFGDFEFVIIDDGSSDGTWDYLASLQDSRLRLVRNPANVGLTRSLNRGLDEAACPFVARMDADDVAMPDRLELQVRFLRDHPDVGVVGCSRVLIDEQGGVVGHAPAAQDNLDIRWKCLLGNPFAHPAVMLRSGVLAAHGLRYDEQYRTAQDYELWSRLLAVTRGANLAEPLMHYRLRNGVSRVHRAEQLRNHDRIARAAIGRLAPGFEPAGDDVPQLRGRFGGHSVRDERMDLSDRRWRDRFLSLLDAFVAAHAAEPGVVAFRNRSAADIVNRTSAAAA